MTDGRPQRTRLAAYVVIVRDGTILLARMASHCKDAGRWSLPGGGVDFGETPADAAVREALEETGFAVKLNELLDVSSRLIERPDEWMHWVRVLYAAEVIGGALTHESDNSTDRCEWLPLGSLATLPLVELVDYARKFL